MTITATEPPVLTLYERIGCHLCEDMRQSLEELAAGSEYRLERVDIDQNPSLQSRFNELVPVLMHGDREICHHFLDFSAVQTVLASYNSKGRGFSDGHHR